MAAKGGNPAIPSAPSPISTRLQVGTLKSFSTLNSRLSNAPERVIINFGTGQATPQTLTSAALYANGPQYLYGIWDWDFGAPTSSGGGLPAGSWNALSPNQQAVALTSPQTIVGPGSGTNLESQTITSGTVGSGANAMGVRTMTQHPICWKGDTACGGSSQTSLAGTCNFPGPTSR